jgi:hypothetical protein
MDSLNTLISEVRTELTSNSLLAAFAAELKGNSPGTAGVFTISIGDINVADGLPSSQIPFIAVIIGDEQEKIVTSAGFQITRRLDFRAGITDDDTDRCTEYVTMLEELVTDVLRNLFGNLVWDPLNNPEGYLRDWHPLPIESDQDYFRPMAFRQISYTVTYTLEGLRR